MCSTAGAIFVFLNNKTITSNQSSPVVDVQHDQNTAETIGNSAKAV